MKTNAAHTGNHFVHYIERGDNEIELHVWFDFSPAEPEVNASESIEITRIAEKIEHGNYSEFEVTDEEMEEIEDAAAEVEIDEPGQEYETD
jgi:hypothetical protein